MEGSVSAELDPMNMMNSVPSNLSPALSKSLEDANKELEAVRARQREAIARALMPNQGKPVAKPQVKNLPPPPVYKPHLKVCKDQNCELPDKLFAPSKTTYKYCPACSRRRDQAAEAARLEEQRVRDQIEGTRREARKTEKLIADLEAGHAFVCTTEGCGTIERPGVGYNPELDFHCFKCREDYRKRKASGQLRAQPQQATNHRPAAPVVEDTATRARKQVKFEAQEFFMKGGEAALPKGVSLHHRNGRQIILKFERTDEETFHHTFTLPISADEKRAQDAAAKKRRDDKRHQIDVAPKGQKGDKNKKDKGRK